MDPGLERANAHEGDSLLPNLLLNILTIHNVRTFKEEAGGEKANCKESEAMGRRRGTQLGRTGQGWQV